MFINKSEYLVASLFNSIVKRVGDLFMERRAYILQSMGNQMVLVLETIGRNKMIQGDSFYMEFVNGDKIFTVFHVGVTAYVNLLENSCSCKEYDLIKMLCAHAMVTL